MNENRRRKRQKNRSERLSFAALPRAVMESKNWARLSPSAIRLLVELAYQYKGGNNGDLTAAFSILSQRGWRSQNTIVAAVKELIHYNMIIKTRQGDLTKKPNLYALTWHPIDYNNGKMDLCSPSATSPGTWALDAEDYDRKNAPKLKRKTKND